MTDRSKTRVGRDVAYRPTDAEATTGNGNAGDTWVAKITAVNDDGTVNLCVFEADGGIVAVTNVSRTEDKGGYSFLGLN